MQEGNATTEAGQNPRVSIDESFTITMATISSSPSHPSGSDFGSGSCAIEAAELRLAAAQKWARASALMLESAQAQAATSQKELQDASDYLAGLKRKRGSVDTNTSARNGKDPPDINLSSLSGSGETGETEAETVISGDDAPNYIGTVKAVKDGVQQDPNAEIGKSGNTHIAFNVDRGQKRSDIENLGGNGAGSVDSKEGRAKIVSPSCSKEGKVTSIGEQSSRSTHSGCVAIEVKDCGIPEINGKYHRFEYSDGVPAYSKIAKYEGKEAIFTIGRWKSDTGTKKWCITATVPRGSLPPKQFAFYVATTTSFVLNPPKKNWMVAEGGGEAFLPSDYEGRGVSPVPIIAHESDAKSGKILGMQVGSKSSRQGRRGLRSASTPKPSRSSRSVSTGRFRRYARTER